MFLIRQLSCRSKLLQMLACGFIKPLSQILKEKKVEVRSTKYSSSANLITCRILLNPEYWNTALQYSPKQQK